MEIYGCVRWTELCNREMFVPLAHAPADFGEALVVIAGVEQKAHYLAMDLPHSDDGKNMRSCKSPLTLPFSPGERR